MQAGRLEGRARRLAVEMMIPSRALAIALLAFAAAACSKAPAEAPTTDPAAATPEPAADASGPAAEVVKNVDAQPGDTTTCPYSGRTFVVEADHPQVEYEGQTYWICSEKAAEEVRADPAKYLADFEG